MSYSGACLCGAIAINVKGEYPGQVICHCTDCKRTTGAPFSALIIVPDSDFKIEGPTSTFQSTALSGSTVTRLFCSKCGSQLAHTSPNLGGKHAVQTGNLPDFAKVPFGYELFTKDRWTGLKPIEGAAQFEVMPPL
ncbi:hypothetical protein AX16_003097 [Volvariella volvacea WC 439]|nr:hypothetical protein AX16_003097 [Volvariella volvacea WC 439]